MDKSTIIPAQSYYVKATHIDYIRSMTFEAAKHEIVLET